MKKKLPVAAAVATMPQGEAMKRFVYFEHLEGGMGTDYIDGVPKYISCYGWMNDYCAKEDAALLEWASAAKVGECREHRVGVLVRLKDAAGGSDEQAG